MNTAPRASGTVVLFANTDWYLWNFRRSLALGAQAAGYDVLLVSPPGEYGARFADIGLRWQPITMDRRSLNPLREAGVLLRLAGLLRRERPVLVHGFTVKCAVYGSFAARLAGLPGRVNAITGMGYVFSSNQLKARLLRPLVCGLFRLTLGGRCARLILQNPDDVAVFEEARLVDPKQIRLIRGSGVDCTRFVPRAPPVLQTGARPLRVLLAARLLWDKGIGEYAGAARALHAKGVTATFLLAGTPDSGHPDGVSESTLHKWVDEGALEWVGQVSDMATMLRDVDVVVLPSYREGLPKSLIEAAACGLPLVTCDAIGCREAVADGENGFLVPPRNVSALASALDRLLRDPALRERMGKASRAKALAEFDERIVIEKTLDVYQEVL